MAVNHQSPQATLPPLKYKQVNTLLWGAGGNTCTITDSYISGNSQLDFWVTGSTPAAVQPAAPPKGTIQISVGADGKPKVTEYTAPSVDK